MSHSSRTDSLRKHAPHSGRTGRSLRLVRVESGALLEFSRSPGMGAETAGVLNVYQGPHFTTRFAASSHVAIRSEPASSQPDGTGASRRFSPSLSKHSHPLLYSLATAAERRNRPLRRSGVRRRSRSPRYSEFPPVDARRSTFRLSAAVGVISHTSHRLPFVSRNVR
jgi:hypothetical protein